MTNVTEDIVAFANETGIGLGLVLEAAVQATYRGILVEGDKAIDIGAHRGDHTFPMAKSVGPKGKIYAFEPIPALFKQLNKDIKKSAIKNIRLKPYALGREKRQTSFNYFSEKPAYSGLGRRDTPFDDIAGGLKKITVEERPLDSLFWWFTRIALIKIDIEGGEFHALQGGKKLLKRSRPVIIFENGGGNAAKTYDYKHQSFYQFFEAMGYSLTNIAGRPMDATNWQNPGPLWELVAAPNEKADIFKKLPDFCRQAMASLATFQQNNSA